MIYPSRMHIHDHPHLFFTILPVHNKHLYQQTIIHLTLSITAANFFKSTADSKTISKYL